MTKYIDSFCRKHPNFGIAHLMKYLTIANIAVWLLDALMTSTSGHSILSYMAFSPYMIIHRGQLWRLASFIFIPPSSGYLAFISFYFYYILGNTLEASWGTAKFTLYFLTGVVLSVIFGFLLYILGINIFLSAHYIYLSLFFSFAALYPDMQVLLFFIIPIKMKWLAIVDAAYFLIDIVKLPFPANLLPVIAMLNFVLFCGEDLFRAFGWKRSGGFGRFGRRGSGNGSSGYSGGYNGGYSGTGTGGKRYGRSGSGPEVVDFKKASEKLRSEQTASLYTHKCAVCGKTDTEYPDLEFRFCSRCAGYHCFCSEHINTHIHFTE